MAMTAAQKQQLNDEKSAHANAILAKMKELDALIESRDDIYWPSTPQVLFQVKSTVEMAARNLRQAFGIEEPTPNPSAPPAPTA